MADPRRPGRMIESMVPSDSGRGKEPNRDIIDEEIYRWLRRLNSRTPFVTLIFDCCHSGSVTRDPFGEATREAPADLRSAAEMFGVDRCRRFLPPRAVPSRRRIKGRRDGCRAGGGRW